MKSLCKIHVKKEDRIRIGCGLISELDGNCSSLPRSTFQGHCSFVISYSMLDNGKAQAGAARGFGMTLIHTVEPFEHPLLVFYRDTNARVFHCQLSILQKNLNTAVGNIIFDSIVTKIIKDLI